MNKEPESMHGWRFDVPLQYLMEKFEDNAEYYVDPWSQSSEVSLEYLLERCRRAERDRDEARKQAEYLLHQMQTQDGEDLESDYMGYKLPWGEK